MLKGTWGKVGDKVEKGNTEVNSNSSADTNRKKKERIMMACWSIGGRGRKGTYICIDWFWKMQDVIVLGFQTGQS